MEEARLALELGASLVEHYADGVWFVDLAPLNDPMLVLPAIAHAAGVRDDGTRPPATMLAEALCARHLLLVLDNCEHLIAACATAADTLLQACPHVQILATSREALRIAGETAWRVPSLTLPATQTASPESLKQYEAVRLFLDRRNRRPTTPGSDNGERRCGAPDLSATGWHSAGAGVGGCPPEWLWEWRTWPPAWTSGSIC